uniref:Uncharacterized protein n=1 Tax=Anguilla anguilla TaxID=7936 RepID=A0A0E9RN26_ANGAN
MLDTPTFLLTHLHQTGLPDLEEEVFVFLVLLVINYFDLYNFAETEKREREKEERLQERKTTAKQDKKTGEACGSHRNDREHQENK